MTLILLLFLAALSLEGIGTYISVIGLAATFAADPIILTMAVVLDFCKIIAVNTLAKKWSSLAKTIRTYLIASTLVLSIITSAGVAGYLSNSFQKAMLPNQGNNIALVSMKAEQERLYSRKKEIDAQISQLPANQVKGRQRLMASFKGETDHINKRLNEIDTEMPKVQTTQAKLHSDVGSIMFLADVANISPEKAVGIIIALIIFVFDPMAIVFLITANGLLTRREKDKLEKPDPEPEVVIDEKDVIEPDPVQDKKPAQEDFSWAATGGAPEPTPTPKVELELVPMEEKPEAPFPIYQPDRSEILEPFVQRFIEIENNPAEPFVAEVVTDDGWIHHEENEPPVIIPEYVPTPTPDAWPFPTSTKITDPIVEPEVEEVEVEDDEEEMDSTPYPFPLEAPREESIVHEEADEPESLYTTDVEVHHVGEPEPMEVDEGLAILQQALQPVREAMTQEEEPHLEEVLKEILKDGNGSMTDAEREKLDRALDRIFALEPQREPSDEPEVEEVEEHQPALIEVPVADPVEAEQVPDSYSLLDNPNLDNIKGTDVQFVGPVWVNPKLLEIYDTKS